MKLLALDRRGWPVETIENSPFISFIILILHTRKVVCRDCWYSRESQKSASTPQAYSPRIRLPKDEEARRCVLIVIKNHIGVIEKIDGDFANVLKYKRSVRKAWAVQLKANLKGKGLIDFISLELEEAQDYAKETWARDMYGIVPVEIHY